MTGTWFPMMDAQTAGSIVSAAMASWIREKIVMMGSNATQEALAAPRTGIASLVPVKRMISMVAAVPAKKKIRSVAMARWRGLKNVMMAILRMMMGAVRHAKRSCVVMASSRRMKNVMTGCTVTIDSQVDRFPVSLLILIVWIPVNRKMRMAAIAHANWNTAAMGLGRMTKNATMACTASMTMDTSYPAQWIPTECAINPARVIP